jgi:hypothetical protein
MVFYHVWSPPVTPLLWLGLLAVNCVWRQYGDAYSRMVGNTSKIYNHMLASEHGTTVRNHYLLVVWVSTFATARASCFLETWTGLFFWGSRLYQFRQRLQGLFVVLESWDLWDLHTERIAASLISLDYLLRRNFKSLRHFTCKIFNAFSSPMPVKLSTDCGLLFLKLPLNTYGIF